MDFTTYSLFAYPQNNSALWKNEQFTENNVYLKLDTDGVECRNYWKFYKGEVDILNEK